MNAICGVELWAAVGYSTIIFLAALQTVPQDIYEALQLMALLGGTNLSILLIPLIWQAFIINILRSFIDGMRVFAQVYGLTNGGPADQSQVFSTFMYKSFLDGLYSQAAAANLLLSVFLLLFSYIFLNKFRKYEVEL